MQQTAQVLRPAESGLAHLRHDRAAEMDSGPGELSIAEGRILSLSTSSDARIRIDAAGCAVVPGFVDCHTHLPFAGWRERELGARVAGVTYEEIARAGGGIRSSARSFAEASDEEILAQAQAAAAEMLAHGTTAFEGKTGYGLSVPAERRALKLARALGGRVAQSTVSTALLAHAVPDGFDADAWVDAIEAALPDLLTAGPPDTLDIYVESVAFGNDHLRRMGALARRHGLALRAHVEQFSTNRSVPAAVELGARSVDHLACKAEEDIPLLASSDTAAVLLPGAEFLGDERVAPARALAAAGAICALASDFNPGTSPVLSIPTIIGLAVRRYGWTVLEALLACTLNAAWVIGCSQELGSLEVGKRADVVILDGPIEAIPYRFGHNPVAIVILGGEITHIRPDNEWRVSR